jgi:hypothetical protein
LRRNSSEFKHLKILLNIDWYRWEVNVIIFFLTQLDVCATQKVETYVQSALTAISQWGVSFEALNADAKTVEVDAIGRIIYIPNLPQSSEQKLVLQLQEAHFWVESNPSLHCLILVKQGKKLKSSFKLIPKDV